MSNIIPDVPDTILSDELKEAIERFPDRLKNWKQNLQLHKYCNVINMADLKGHFHANGGGVDEEDYLRLYNSDDEMDIIATSSDKSVTQTLADKIVLVFAGYACIAQFIAGKEWPDTLGDDDEPNMLLAEFKLGNTAIVRLRHDRGLGELFWERKEINFSGTWEEVAQHLIKLYEKVSKEFDI